MDEKDLYLSILDSTSNAADLAGEIFMRRHLEGSDSFGMLRKVWPLSFYEAIINGNAVVENKTFPFPKRVIGRNRFQIIQNSTSKLINFFETKRLQIRSEFFAADAAGAKNRDAFVRLRIKLTGNEVGQLAELRCSGINGSFEGAGTEFVIVSCVEHEGCGIPDYPIPFPRTDMRVF